MIVNITFCASEKSESGDIVFAMIADLEHKLQIETLSELQQMLNAFFVDLWLKADCWSIFGRRRYIAAMIDNEGCAWQMKTFGVETLFNAKHDDNCAGRALMCCYGQLGETIDVSRQLNVRMDILNQVIDAGISWWLIWIVLLCWRSN